MTDAGRRPARVLALMGPTASGKSAVAHQVARRIGGELVVADPFQRYRGLEIAADTPGPQARAEVRHHCILDLDLTERSTAAAFAERAHAAIDDILRRGRVPVVSGGTGLYMRAALSDLGFPPEPSDDAREAAERDALTDPDGALAELRALDPDRAAAIDHLNPRRVGRALALARTAGGPLPRGDALWARATRHPTLLVALSRPRDELDRRIAVRVRRELGDGLVAELEAALDTPGLAREPGQIIGMREVAAMRAGELGADDLPGRLEARTRRLARKQLTWLRKTPGLISVDLGARDPGDATDEVIALWEDS
jgi:tRNA dimethylallyltransferase